MRSSLILMVPAHCLRAGVLKEDLVTHIPEGFKCVGQAVHYNLGARKTFIALTRKHPVPSNNATNQSPEMGRPGYACS